MANGIKININDFKSLSIKEQNSVLFQNIDELKKMLELFKDSFEKHIKTDYKFYIITSASIFILSFMLGINLGWFKIPWI